MELVPLLPLKISWEQPGVTKTERVELSSAFMELRHHVLSLTEAPSLDVLDLALIMKSGEVHAIRSAHDWSSFQRQAVEETHPTEVVVLRVTPRSAEKLKGAPAPPDVLRPRRVVEGSVNAVLQPQED